MSSRRPTKRARSGQASTRLPRRDAPPQAGSSRRTKLIKGIAAAVGVALLGPAAVWFWDSGARMVNHLLHPEPVSVFVEPQPQPQNTTPGQSPTTQSGASTSATGNHTSPSPSARASAVTGDVSLPAQTKDDPALVTEPFAFAGTLPVAQTLATLDSLAPGQDPMEQWVLANGGYELGTSRIRIVLEGRDQPVTIVNAHASIIKRDPIPTKTLLLVGSQGASDAIHTNLDLDRTDPQATFFSDHTITLQPGESATIDLDASVNRSAVVWDLSLDIVIGGGHRTMTVSRSKGVHFRTAAWPDQRQHDVADVPVGSYTTEFYFVPQTAPVSGPYHGWRECVPSNPANCQRF